MTNFESYTINRNIGEAIEVLEEIIDRVDKWIHAGYVLPADYSNIQLDIRVIIDQNLAPLILGTGGIKNPDPETPAPGAGGGGSTVTYEAVKNIVDRVNNAKKEGIPMYQLEYVIALYDLQTGLGLDYEEAKQLLDGLTKDA